MKTIIVTWWLWYIGSILTDEAMERWYRVVVVDNMSVYSKIIYEKVLKYFYKKMWWWVWQMQFYDIDVTNEKEIEKILLVNEGDSNVEAIFHFAALKSVEEWEKEPIKYMNVNIIWTHNMLKLAIKLRVPFIFSSSIAAYWKEWKLKEEDLNEAPENIYWYTKYVSDTEISRICKRYDLSYYVFRYWNPIWARWILWDYWKSNIIPALFDAYLNKKVFRIFGSDYETPDWTALRDYVDVNELVKFHLDVLPEVKKKRWEYNLWTWQPISVLEIVNKFIEIVWDVEYKFVERREWDLEKYWCDITKIKRVFNRKLKLDLENVFNQLKNFYKLNRMLWSE